MGLVEQLEPSKAEQDEEKDELACKICYGQPNDESPLLHGVCDCKGSLDGVHGRCLVKWQLKRASKPWNCEICDSKIQWPASETLKLVELLSELSEKKTPPPGPRAGTASAERRRTTRNQGPSKWQIMSSKCLLAVRSVRTAGKSLFLPGTRDREHNNTRRSEEAGATRTTLDSI